jgi:hypothetical protein
MDNSMTRKLIATLGEEEVKQTWQRLGMYKAAAELTNKINEYVSPSTLRYLSNLYDWKRNVNINSPIYKCVIAGKVPAAYYKHLIFPTEVNKNVNV